MMLSATNSTNSREQEDQRKFVEFVAKEFQLNLREQGALHLIDSLSQIIPDFLLDVKNKQGVKRLNVIGFDRKQVDSDAKL